MGSITEGILGSTKLPLFVVHPQEMNTIKQSEEATPARVFQESFAIL
jgi:hypothetical protein